MTDKVEVPASMHILVIEDDEPTASEIKAQILAGIPDSSITTVRSFDRGLSLMEHSCLDAVVLDLYEGIPRPDKLRGGTLWQEIWRRAFVPVIVHTGGEELLDPRPPDRHPFVRVLKKGMGSIPEIVETLKRFREASSTISLVYRELREAASSSLRDAVPALVLAGIPEAEVLQVLLGIGRRRVAARLDHDNLVTGVLPQPFERYIYPPLGDNLLTGDILRRKEGRTGKAEDLSVILTPSCDLVEAGDRKPVQQVLLARCKGMNFYAQKEGLLNAKEEKLREGLPVQLRSPKTLGLVFLPELKGVLPNMVVDARDVVLVGFEHVRKEYDTVASLDSPFREQIAWAFIQVLGRPGAPDHNLSPCIESIIKELTAEKQRGS